MEVIEIDCQSASPEPDVVDLTTEEESLSPSMEWDIDVVQVTDSDIEEQNGEHQLEMTDKRVSFTSPRRTSSVGFSIYIATVRRS